MSERLSGEAANAQQAQQQATSAEAAREAALHDLAQLQQDLATHRQQLQADVAAGQQRLQEEQAHSQQLQDEITALRQQVIELRQQTAAEALQDATVKDQQLRDEITALKQQVTEVQQQAEADALQDANAKQSTDLKAADLCQQLESSLAHMGRLRSQLTAAEDQISSLETDLAASAQRSDGLQKAVEKSEALVASMQAQQMTDAGYKSRALTPPATPPARMTHPAGHPGPAGYPASGNASATATANATINIGPYSQQRGGRQEGAALQAGSLQSLHLPHGQKGSSVQPWQQPLAGLQGLPGRQEGSLPPTQQLLLDEASRPSTSELDNSSHAIVPTGNLQGPDAVSDPNAAASGAASVPMERQPASAPHSGFQGWQTQHEQPVPADIRSLPNSSNMAGSEARAALEQDLLHGAAASDGPKLDTPAEDLTQKPPRADNASYETFTAAEAQDVRSSPHNSSPSPELEGLSSDHGAVRQSGQLAAAASSASITANWSPGDEAEGGEDADAATLVQNEGPVFDDERLTGLGTGL